jgi:peptidoglycan/LPS O-acetylase OafA/YrhL
MEKATTNSRNLDLLRSLAVLLVVGFHLAKLFNWEFPGLRVTDVGLLGVMLFFVHTTLVLMFSLERQRSNPGSRLFLPFMIRRCFRIYPLAMLVVAFVFLFHVPSDLQFGRFDLMHQSAANVIANLLLIQNVALQKANPGVLWSLPFELQMYVALPALFLLTLRAKSSWAPIAFWWAVVAFWFSLGWLTGTLPLSAGGIRSPAEAFLKFTRFAPCFLPGIVAYKLWSQPRRLPGWLWPVFLCLCCAGFVRLAGSEPIETGWFLCFVIGLGVPLFREMKRNLAARLAQQVARYSYGIYLLHYFALWIGFVICGHRPLAVQFAIFVTVLVALAVILYHAMEAPCISLGVRLSDKLRFGSDAIAISRPSGQRAI